MEISSIKPSEALLQILHPTTGEELGITISAIYIEDEESKRMRRAIRDRANKLAGKGQAFKAEEEDHNLYELCFRSIKSWDWQKNTFHGEIPEFNRKNVFDVFEEMPWFVKQVSEYISEPKNFFV